MAEEWREQVGFLRSLDGMAAHILLALLVAGRRLAADDLAMATGCDKRTVRRGLALLEALGLVERVALDAGGWALPAAVRGQLVGLPEEGAHAARNGAHALRAASSSSSLSISLKLEDEGEKKKKKGARGAQQEVEGLLLRAGIGRTSPKLGELLALGLDAGYVREHVAAREAALAKGEAYPVGWLINKLACGDPAPVCRCGRCEVCRERTLAKYPMVMR